ncbi:hypothetical protein BH18ACI3_BH18ACI3_17730 [soil metagenome]
MKTDRLSLENITKVSFLVLVFSLGFMQPSLYFGGSAVQLTDLAFLLAGALWLASLLNRKTTFRLDPLFLPLAFYFFALLLSAVFSVNPRISFIKLLGESYLIGLAVLTFNFVRSVGFCRKVIFVWLAASSVTSLIGLFTIVLFYIDRSNVLHEYFLHHYGSLTPGNYPRIQSTFVYPSLLCNYLTVSILFVLAIWRLGWIRRNLALLLLALYMVTAAFTITPGLGGILLGIFVWCSLVLENNKKKFSQLSLHLGVISAFAFFIVSAFTLRPIPTSPFRYVLFGFTVDPTQRLLAWKGAFETFLDNPFTGKGLGLGAANVLFMPPSGEMQLLTDAHNTWLNISGQSGIAAVAAISVLCILLLRRSLPFDLDNSELSALRSCFGIAFISAFLFQGLVGSFENARHLWVLIGLILSVGSFPKENS